MKIVKKATIVIMVIFIFSLFTMNINVNAIESTDKIYCSATIDDNFDSSTIQVVLSDVASASNKEYTINDFSEINCSAVVDITKTISDDIKNGKTNLIDSNGFKRVLNITINNPSKINILNAISVLEQRNDIYSASPNYYIEYFVKPNDALINNQWSIENINLPNAWNINTGSNNVIVGVIDTGIDGEHIELENRINTNLSKDFANDSTLNPLEDPVGHGTHVAGIIGAEGDNEIGITGVCWDVTLVSLKVLNDSDQIIYNSDVVEAIYYAASNNIPIINMSLGSYYDDPTIATAIQTYTGLVVAAAGNEERNTDIYLCYPASYNFNNIISVGATNSSNNLWVSSNSFGGTNYGKNTVDLFAPGDSILSTVPDNYVKTETGTSMAAPHVTGVAALLLSEYPNLSATAIKKIIMNGVDNCVDSSGNLLYDDLCVSEGKLNAYQSLISYRTLTKNVETEVINNLNHGKGLFGFSYYGSGFVDITMNAVIQNATPTYPYGSFRLLNSKGEVVKKYEMTDYSDEAINKNGYNTLSVFLPESGYYYIDVDYDVENLSSLKLLVENNDVYSPSVNLFNFNDYQEFSIDFIDNISSVDYIKQITLKQAASFEFDITLSGSARFVVLKRTSSSASSELTVIENEVIIGNNTIEVNLSHGTYYIGYFDLSQGGTFGLTMNRFVTESGSSLLITDPDQYTNCGSQITVAEMNTHASNRSYRQNTIIEGFTRIIYLGNGNTRQAYYWYSSNEDVATVSEFGTVFAQNVTQDTTVKIMAVYKTDPSIVYIKEFRILNDTESYESSPLDIDGITLNVHAGQFTYITFGDKDVPINWLQYYSWESSDTDYVTVDGFGRIYAYSSAIGETFTITGIYNYNTRVKITITVNIIE